MPRAQKYKSYVLELFDRFELHKNILALTWIEVNEFVLHRYHNKTQWIRLRFTAAIYN